MSVPELERAFREEWGAVVATLARRLGDLQAAEDAAAEAFAVAATAWPWDGVPPDPGGWLTVTAWRKAAVAEQATAPHQLDDDRLGLIFACCHPALALEVRVAMTLRYVAGLSTRQIAAAFLVPEATLAQRLVRAKRKITDAGIRFEVPARPAERLASVRTVAYLVFNEGLAAPSGGEPIRGELCEEAIRIGRLLHRLLPADAETAGLLALMLLHHALATARQAEGKPVPLEEQDRTRWDRTLIAEGTRLLDVALKRREPGIYQLRAAIAALHALAACFEDTDWQQVIHLYGILARLAPVLASGAPRGYSPSHAARDALLDKAGYPERARGAWPGAAETSASAALREELLRRHEKP